MANIIADADRILQQLWDIKQAGYRSVSVDGVIQIVEAAIIEDKEETKK